MGTRDDEYCLPYTQGIIHTVCKKSHAEGSQRCNCRRRRDQVPLHDLHTKHVGRVQVAGGVIGSPLTNTGAATLRGDICIDGYDISHGEEGGESGADLCEETGTFALEAMA